MERRVAVEQLRDGADGVVVDLVLVAHHLALHEAQPRPLVQLQAGLHVEAAQPRPCRALVVGIVALRLRTHIHRVVATALRRQAPQALWRQQLAGADVHHALHLLLAQRRVVQRHGEDLVRTHAPVHHRPVHVVQQIAIFVHERVHERRLRLPGQCLQVLGGLLVALVVGHRGAELQGVIPQRVELHDISAPRHHGPSVRRRVHPRHGVVPAVRVEQPVVV